MYSDYPLQYNVLRAAAEELKGRMYRRVCNFDIEGYVTAEPVPFSERGKGSFRKFEIGDNWGGLFDCGWFRMHAHIPAGFTSGDLYIKLDLSGEALLFDSEGCPVKGFTSVRSRRANVLGGMGKTVYPAKEFIRGGEIEFWVDAGNNDLFGEYLGGEIAEACLAVRSPKLRELYYDFAVLCELMETVSADTAWHHRIKNVLSETELILKDYTEEEAERCLVLLKPVLGVRNARTGFDVSALGHAHLDLAWTWPIRETRRKAARTFSTALSLMEAYPDYIFTASQAQLFSWIKEDHPDLYERIKGKIRNKNFEPQGGMWVESDLNIPGGESLVRQFLYGQRFFEEEFGKPAEVCWLPDSFGFPGCLPQLIRGAGMKYFLTMKIRTAPHNIVYPHDTFWWEGIDGTRVLAHCSPFEGYNSAASPAEIREGERRFRDKGRCPSALMLYGQGDGGGGAGCETLEALARESRLEGLPPVVKRSALQFFERIERAGKYDTWSGCMDLDMHTGTLTSAAEIKHLNKEAEKALHTAEWIAAVSQDRSAQERLRGIWKSVLLYQFHDILTGTSIMRVYEEAKEHYAELLAEIGQIASRGVNILSEHSAEAEALLNPAPFARTCFAEREGKLFRAEIGAYAFEIPVWEESRPSSKVRENVIENAILRVRFSPDGAVVSVKDKRSGYEFISGASNRLRLYEDDLLCGDEKWSRGSAWDIPIRFKGKLREEAKLLEAKTFATKTAAVCIQRYSVGNSIVEQRIELPEGAARIDFRTSVDWAEKRKMLRSEFSLNIYAREAARGIQFGTVRQNMHKNTVWDESVFEVCAQRFLDVSDGARGAALIAPEKYGYRVQDGQPEICLLRSSDYPAEGLDLGRHTFTYSLFVHEGDHTGGGVLREAYLAEYPVQKVSGVRPFPQRFAVRADVENIIAETIKAGEDGGTVVRLYEAYGRAQRTALAVKGASAVWETDLTERKRIKRYAVKNGRIELFFHPYEIKTLYMEDSNEGRNDL